MPQIQLPFFPEGVTQISDLLAFRVEDGRVTYFNGNMPVSVHDRGTPPRLSHKKTDVNCSTIRAPKILA